MNYYIIIFESPKKNEFPFSEIMNNKKILFKKFISNYIK